MKKNKPLKQSPMRYTISESGEIYSNLHENNVQVYSSKSGTAYVDISIRKGEKKRFRLKHLVWSNFSETPILHGYKLTHKNGDKMDCRFTNLELIRKNK